METLFPCFPRLVITLGASGVLSVEEANLYRKRGMRSYGIKDLLSEIRTS